jgi:hypothetical protein
MTLFSEKDKAQIVNHGMTVETVENQLQQFKTGFPPIKLDRVATIGDGIQHFDANSIAQLVSTFEETATQISILKFVPASGAASRMFQALFAFLDNQEKTAAIIEFEANMDKFAFADELKQLSAETTVLSYIDTVLNNMQFGQLPKALIPFHNYAQGNRTAIEEHLMEGVEYANAGNKIALHFTVSPEHEQKIKTLLDEKVPAIEAAFDVTFNISFSIQSPSTDTIAANEDNGPFRTIDGSLFFRPGGHGALIKNLDEQDADLIFVKNIDNVRPDEQKPDTIKYKKVIAGYLLEQKNRIHNLLSLLEGDAITLAEAEASVANDIGYTMPEAYYNGDDETKKLQLMSFLDRPIRVCGMVINEGEPGGGPFWVQDHEGRTSLQIVEKSQIDTANPVQNEILLGSTHFNPVDLVCWVKDRHGKKYDLINFVDPDTGFISEKSKDGKVLKAMELPGLWNGAMADWITFFVEVPSTTFSPVKAVNDLLRAEHQPLG